MALIPMEYMGGVEGDTITKDSRSDLANATLDRTTCYKKDHIVTVAGRLSGMTATATGVFFHIPEGFRPIGTTWVIGQYVINNEFRCAQVVINTNGNVEFPWSNGAVVTGVAFFATYRDRE